MRIEDIHESAVNGQKKQMVRQIDEYGLYDFWADYNHFLRDTETPINAYNCFVDATVSYFRIKERFCQTAQAKLEVMP